ncbi:MAG: alpha/beta hydrolase [Pseudomonadota bacterium]
MALPKLRSASKLQHFRASDLQGLARLATDGIHGVTRIAEGVHTSVLRNLGLAPAQPDAGAGGLTGLIYNSVRGVTSLVGQGLDATLARLLPVLDAGDGVSSAQREIGLAVLNGVLGDQLAARANPLATPMGLYRHGQAVQPATVTQPTGKVLLLIHGLCMNDLQWHDSKTGHNHGEALAELGYTPVYLRYNTGRHVSENGEELARLLQRWLAEWPQPVEELVVVAHSMGGLVMRSACHYAAQADLDWPMHLKKIVFLGTPHHGAPLERAGNWIDVLLGSNRYAAPFARLGKIRSAGITDLRHGNVLAADWAGRDRFEPGPDARHPLPLPAGVACYTVAATTAAQRSAVSDRLVGDGLVPLRSALGEHDNPALQLNFPARRRWIAFGMGHLALLRRPEVTEKLKVWLASNARVTGSGASAAN